MHERLINFLKHLTTYYRKREDIIYVVYDGSAVPIEFRNEPLCEIDFDEKEEEILSWLNCYLVETREVSYYHLYKSLTRDFLGLWVNPSLDELQEFNCQNNLPAEYSLCDMPDCEKLWFEYVLDEISKELEEHGYKIVSGYELIEHILHVHDEHVSENIPLSEWLKPSYIETIDNEAYYLLDMEVEITPLLVEKDFFYERDNQRVIIPTQHLLSYFEALMVTRRGLDSTEVMEDRMLEMKQYQNLEHYLKREPCETKETALEKLFVDAVNPSERFIELIIDGMGEIYINHSNLRTEKDILDFVNMAYSMEEVDREAKSFNRKKLLIAMMDDHLELDAYSKPVEHTWGQIQEYDFSKN